MNIPDVVFYKTMLSKLRNDWLNGSQSRTSFFLFILLIVSLFLSRVLLSASIIALVILSLFHGDIKRQARVYLSTPLLWGMSLLFVLPLISGFWSDDKNTWLDIMKIKLPLLLLPFAFASGFEFSAKQWRILALFFIAAVVCATAWSIFYYLPDAKAVNESYLRAKIMTTPLENDHVRFSWLVSMAILFSGSLGIQHLRAKRKINWLLLLITAWLVIYLHLLAARTGLISLYMMAIAVVLWLIFLRKKVWVGLITSVAIISLPILAYQFIPSFHNRVRFFMYDRGFFEKANYLAGGTDAVRVISIRAGWELMNGQPLHGTGFGDIRASAITWYDTNYPGMRKEDQVDPSSEWMMYGAGAGWPGLMVFILSMLTPFFTRVKQKGAWFLLNTMAAFSLMVDIGLEVQYGVFVYSFIILWCWKWFNAEIS